MIAKLNMDMKKTISMAVAVIAAPAFVLRMPLGSVILNMFVSIVMQIIV
jgi:hypothetical protein